MSYAVGKCKPPNHSRFKPGQSGNPAGARLHCQDTKALRKLLIPEVQAVFSKFLLFTISELGNIKRDPQTPALHLIMIAVIEKGIKNSDAKIMDKILDRVVGKPASQMNHEVVLPSRPIEPDLTEDERTSRIDYLSAKAGYIKIEQQGSRP